MCVGAAGRLYGHVVSATVGMAARGGTASRTVFETRLQYSAADEMARSMYLHASSRPGTLLLAANAMMVEHSCMAHELLFGLAWHAEMRWFSEEVVASSHDCDAGVVVLAPSGAHSHLPQAPHASFFEQRRMFRSHASLRELAQDLQPGTEMLTSRVTVHRQSIESLFHAFMIKIGMVCLGTLLRFKAVGLLRHLVT